MNTYKITWKIKQSVAHYDKSYITFIIAPNKREAKINFLKRLGYTMRDYTHYIRIVSIVNLETKQENLLETNQKI